MTEVERVGFFEVLAFDISRTLFTFEGRVLFVLIEQTIIAKDVLRKYAVEGRHQCESMGSNIAVVPITGVRAISIGTAWSSGD